jgi:uncharacterized protein (TIGR01777 family)
MKIVIPGGSGQVGTLLARAFTRDGHEVTVLSRNPTPGAAWRVLPWDAAALGRWTAELEGADAVINLAGKNVNCRYTPENRNLIMESRVNSTRVIAEAIARCHHPPKVWLQASTATIYSDRYDAPNDEATGQLGGAEPGVPGSWHFSIEVATAWERAVGEITEHPTRKVLMRSAIAMNADPGSAFRILLRLVKFGLGGRAGDGRQFVSWIHETDFVRAVYWLIGDSGISGVVNIASPNPLPNAEFMRLLREAWGTTMGLPSAKWMLELGAKIIGTETELLLKSRRVVPEILLQRGFRFDYPKWADAAAELCGRSR